MMNVLQIRYIQKLVDELDLAKHHQNEFVKKEKLYKDKIESLFSDVS
jgi:hypothetical protein